MAGGKKIQGEAELCSVTNSACGVVSWALQSGHSVLSVIHIVVAQTFLELHWELDMGLGLILLWFCVLGFFAFGGFFFVLAWLFGLV